MSREQVRLAISMGDPVGVGPEIILGAIPIFAGNADITVYGDLGVLKAAAAALSEAGRPGPDNEREISLEAVTVLADSELRFGNSTQLTGDASYRYVMTAMHAVLAGEADALVTAPINKNSWMAAGHQYPGHTELLAERAEVSEYAMMLVGPSLRVVPVTTHIPLSEVSRSISTEKILSTIKLVNGSLREWFGVDAPHIACAALNPHAGEGGRMGHEEEKIILPAIEAAASEGIMVEGPLPADTLFSRRADYDAIVCMYHDQALVPIKTLHPFESVNMTLGLPFVRTSPDHGTAYDIAGKGIAKPESMLAAMEMAVRLVETRHDMDA